ncbi:peamaclein isoform X1 [Salvia miltiorrhiza]|uniref:peamaclein isoform X1 n=2 Tax=Salvia miltiorrhiza TaxID=226208 RepID=UPI0025AC629F|nr:peamaclein isoform X1 [Salvia miltiorrhiza]
MHVLFLGNSIKFRANMKPMILGLVTLLLILTTAFAVEDVGGSSFCDSKCNVRCSKAGRRDRCLKYCGICCEKCNCVPSGTYGNKDECPCYRDMKNSKGNPKCP